VMIVAYFWGRNHRHVFHHLFMVFFKEVSSVSAQSNLTQTHLTSKWSAKMAWHEP
jgi:hypothetical protein